MRRRSFSNAASSRTCSFPWRRSPVWLPSHAWMFKRQQGAMGGLLGGGKQRRVDPETVRVNFDDVAGIDEVEAEINEVVDFLKDPGKYRRVGARAPKGVLLRGHQVPVRRSCTATAAEAGEAKMPASHAL